ncbi:MAG: hypothetical protein ACOYKM_14675, partial [Caulobacterales bacterium]
NPPPLDPDGRHQDSGIAPVSARMTLRAKPRDTSSSFTICLIFLPAACAARTSTRLSTPCILIPIAALTPSDRA